jgi:hypothetical protein
LADQLPEFYPGIRHQPGKGNGLENEHAGGSNRRHELRVNQQRHRLVEILPADPVTGLLLEIVDHDLFHERLHALLHKLQVLRVQLIFVLLVLVAKFDVERDLVRLIHNGAVTARHFANMEVFDARDAFQKFIGTGYHRVGGLGLGGIGPKNDHVAELGGFCGGWFHK